MLTVQGDLLGTYVEYVAGAFTALLPLWGAIVGLFLAFAIAHSVAFFIKKLIR